MLRHQDRGDIIVRDALRLQVQDHRESEAKDGIDITLCQHRFAHRKADGLDGDLAIIDLGDLLERLPLGEGAIRRRRAKLLAFQRLRVFRDAQGLATDNCEGRPLIDHVNGLHLLCRIFVEELHDGIDIAEAHLVGAGCNPWDGFDGAVAAIDRDIQALGLEISLIEREQKACGRAFEFPVEREFDRRIGESCNGCDGDAGEHGKSG